MKKIMVMFVLILLVLSVFAQVEESEVIEEQVEDCGFWCKVNKFLFGDKDLRAATGTAWFDRSEALVGKVYGLDPPQVVEEKLEEKNKKDDLELAKTALGVDTVYPSGTGLYVLTIYVLKVQRVIM